MAGGLGLWFTSYGFIYVQPFCWRPAAESRAEGLWLWLVICNLHDRVGAPPLDQSIR